MVVNALAHWALLQLVFDLKATQMNGQCSLIQEIMLYDFDMDHVCKSKQKICCVKGR